MDLILIVSAALVFLGVFLLSMRALRSGTYRPGYLNFALIGVGFGLQSAFLSRRGELHGRCPITDGAEVLVFIAWSLAIMYFALGRAFRLSLLGAFTAPILVTLHLGALLIGGLKPPVPRPLETMDPFLELHAAMSLLAYGAFGLGAIAGIMYLVQNRQLKSGAPGQLAFNLPPIRYLTDALVRLVGIGLLLLTIGVASAFFMEKRPDFVHLSISGAVWVIYAGVLLFYLLKHPTAKWLSLASLVAFGIALITLSAL